MKIEIVNESEDKLLHRKEIQLRAEFEKNTPSNDIVNKELCDKFKFNPELLKLNKIKQTFGQRSADIMIYVYKDIESFKKVENRKKKQKTEEKK